MQVLLLVALGLAAVVAHHLWQTRQPVELGAKEWRTADERDAAALVSGC